MFVRLPGQWCGGRAHTHTPWRLLPDISLSEWSSFKHLRWQGEHFSTLHRIHLDSCYVLLGSVSTHISLVLHFAWGQSAARQNNVYSCFPLCTSWRFSLQLKTQPVGSANTILKSNTCKFFFPPLKKTPPPFNKYSFYITFTQRGFLLLFRASCVFHSRLCPDVC